VIGISKDSVKSHDKFCRKHGLSIVLASDEAGHTSEDYGVWLEKSMYGKTYMGIERTTVLIDGAGKVVRVWNKVSVKGHADEVLAAVVSL
jgi:thioredoxin-dependent peroxiredoxin